MPTSDPFGHAFHLHQQGRLREAFAAYNTILATAPAHAPALHYSGLALHQSGYPELALPRLQRSVAIDPTSADAWSNLALVYQALGQYVPALDALSHATRLAPRDAAVWENYAAALLDADRPADAEHAARTAAKQQPRSPGAWYNLALALQRQRRDADALQAVRRALSLAPDAPALAGLEAALLEAQAEPAAARARLETALHRADHPALRFQLASLCERTGDLLAAATAYERLLDADPEGAALSQLLFLRKRLAYWHDLDALRRRFRAGIGSKPMLSPFCLLSDPSSRAEQRRCAEAWSRAFEQGSSSGTVAAQGVGTGSRALSGDRLTIGYLSADFHMHATALLTAGLFELHDRKRYHVIGYSTGRDDESPLRKRVEKAFDSFVDAQNWSVSQLADRIRADGVDILVDLKGHTEDARMDVLARRPAAVQVSYLGYPGTTGTAFIDYVIGDAIVTPVEHAPGYTETIVQLPGCYQVNDRSRVIASPLSRESLGLPPTSVVLCSFNQIYKINPEVFDTWTTILRHAGDAVLWLLARAADDPVIANLRREAEQRGIAGERIVFATTRPNAEYLALYEHAQFALDPWPYNGHTTTSDALWAGCPVLTLRGETFASRVAASIVTAAGLPELVAGDVRRYVELAVELAADGARCARLRDELRTRGRASPLFDVEGTARSLEAAFEAMAVQHREGRRAPIIAAELSRA